MLAPDYPLLTERLALRRLGMRQEAVLVENEWFKGAWTTEIDFALLDRERRNS